MTEEELIETVLDELERAAKYGEDAVFEVSDISKWHCAYYREGDIRECDIAGIVTLTSGVIVWFEGWCDTTGWGCQDGFEWGNAETLDAALLHISEQVREKMTGVTP
jgi:hypothetical protein